MRTLLLTRKEIRPLLTMQDAINAVRLGFEEKGHGRVEMPSKLYLHYPKYGGDLRCMPTYMEGLNISSVKIVNAHPDNPVKHGLRLLVATILLIEPETGRPLAILDGTDITDFRTGAAGGVAIQYLARKDAKVAAIIGAGKQARTQLIALLLTRPNINEVRIFDISKENKESFVRESTSLHGKTTRIVSSSSAKDAIVGAEIVVTTTPSRSPLVSNEWISAGIHINCIGADAPGKQELDPKILKRSKIILDDWAQGCHSGEVNVPLSTGIITRDEIHGEFGDILGGGRIGRTSDKEITIFSSTGLALQDAMVAKLIYDKAVAQGIGTSIDMYD